MAHNPTQPSDVAQTINKVKRMARRPYPRTAVLASLASLTAFSIASLSPLISPVVAAITALIGIRPTFHASVEGGLKEFGGAALGALVAGVLVVNFGFNALTFFVTMVLGFLIAWWLKMGEQGAIAMGVTIILIISDFSAEAIEVRVLGVLVGGVVAMGFSYFTRPGKPTDRILDDVFGVAHKLSMLLTSMATDLLVAKGAVSRKSADSWSQQADATMSRLGELRAAAEDVVRGSRWSPWVGKEEAKEVLHQVMVVRSFAMTVNGICRDLNNAARSSTVLPHEVAVAFADSMTAAAMALEEQARLSLDAPAELLDPNSDTVKALRMTRELLVDRSRDLDETRPILLSGALAQEAENLSKIISAPERKDQ